MLKRENKKEWKDVLSQLSSTSDARAAYKRRIKLRGKHKDGSKVSAKFFSAGEIECIAKRITLEIFKIYPYRPEQGVTLLNKIIASLSIFQNHYTLYSGYHGFLFGDKITYFDVRDFEKFFVWGIKIGYKDKLNELIDFIENNKIDELILLFFRYEQNKWSDIFVLNSDVNDHKFIDNLCPSSLVNNKRFKWLVFVTRLYYNYLESFPEDLRLESFVDLLPAMWRMVRSKTECSEVFFKRVVAYSLSYYILCPDDWRILIRKKIIFDIENDKFNESNYPLCKKSSLIVL